MSDVLEDWLDLFDGYLARGKVQLFERPFYATDLLLRHAVEKMYSHHSGEYYEYNDINDKLASKEFCSLYRSVNSWYVKRYGEAFERSKSSYLTGVVLIKWTPFFIEVPTSVHSPGEEGDTVWVTFPKEILEHEDPISWVLTPPNVDLFKKDDYNEMLYNCHFVANRLRLIKTRLMGTERNGESGDFCDSILYHLENATSYIYQYTDLTIQKSWWELQMALECCMKAKQIQDLGRATYTHNIQILESEMNKLGIFFNDKKSVRCPKKDEISELRYGRGSRVEIEETFEAYKTALGIISTISDNMPKLRMQNSSVLLQRPPWLSG